MTNTPRANKEFGQHYLRDQSVIGKIVNDHEGEYDIIVEVGPGPAVLTSHLVKKNVPVYVIELDKRFEEILTGLENLNQIFFEDALNFNWSNFISENQLEDKRIWLVSNLPYNVSSQLFIQFTRIPQITCMTLMYQKEVGEKTYLRDKEKNQMSSLLVHSLVSFKSKSLGKVLPGAFNPPPKVNSIVISYKRLPEPLISRDEINTKLEKFVRSIFSQKRKQLGTTLKSQGHNKLVEKLVEKGFKTNLRAEALSIEQVLEVYKYYITSLS